MEHTLYPKASEIKRPELNLRKRIKLGDRIVKTFLKFYNYELLEVNLNLGNQINLEQRKMVDFFLSKGLTVPMELTQELLKNLHFRLNSPGGRVMFILPKKKFCLGEELEFGQYKFGVYLHMQELDSFDFEL